MIQVFCIYHAYKHKTEQKWFWIIIVFPFIGSCIYLYHHFYNRRNIEGLKEGFKETFIENYTIKKLEKELKFSDTYNNRLLLAKEHVNVGNNHRAIEVLETFCEGSYANDYDLNATLLQANYEIDNFQKAVDYGNKIEDVKEFVNSNFLIAYAWANYRIGQISKADQLFEKIDHKYCNYDYRLEYAYFLNETDRKAVALQKLEDLMEEINEMDSYEKNLNKRAAREIKNLYRKIRT